MTLPLPPNDQLDHIAKQFPIHGKNLANGSVLPDSAAPTASAVTLTGVNAEGTADTFARSDHNHAFPAWSAYTPVWSSSGTQPALGNGTIAGRFIQMGKLTIYNIVLTMGTTTTFGTGTYLFSLPATSATTNSVPHGGAFAQDTGTANYLGTNVQQSTTTCFPGFGSPALFTTPTSPHTWAATDVLRLSGTYEAA